MMKLDNKPSTWRDNWFVKNILVEIPIIGGFFRSANLGHAAHHVVKSGFMLAGGTTAMLFNIMQVSENDSSGVRIGKMAGDMVVGMTAGKVLYNSLFFVGKKSVEGMKKCRDARRVNDEYDLLINSERLIK